MDCSQPMHAIWPTNQRPVNSSWLDLIIFSQYTDRNGLSSTFQPFFPFSAPTWFTRLPCCRAGPGKLGWFAWPARRFPGSRPFDPWPGRSLTLAPPQGFFGGCGFRFVSPPPTTPETNSQEFRHAELWRVQLPQNQALTRRQSVVAPAAAAAGVASPAAALPAGTNGVRSPWMGWMEVIRNKI
jgi:hypothetical protein